ncbi:MAG: phosphoribosylaminoimidazolesuccinocarboxamide synthase [Thermoanaerobaculia bacterium]|nr:phosphoribosylaminoimidazolesuccinocarboxamide synthase [Thermoanaerobaculia bacterium]
MPGDPLGSTDLPFPLHRRGKVRDVYDLGDALLLVATDRISAFDVVLSPGIAGKGVLLTQISNFWFRHFDDVHAHLVETDFDRFPDELKRHPELRDRSVIAKNARVIPVECVARGYLIGSGLKDYRKTGSVCGIELPPGLEAASRLPEPIFTPATKAEKGHDENISFAEVESMIGADLAARLRELTLQIYRRASDYARDRGIIIADTKFEFGLDEQGELVWIDEALTPDSSRFWPTEEYAVGSSPPSFDKQYVRDFLETTDWDKTSPAPELPSEVVEGTRKRYAEAYRKLTGGGVDL